MKGKGLICAILILSGTALQAGVILTEDSLLSQIQSLPEDSVKTGLRQNLARIYNSSGRHQEAIELYLANLEQCKKVADKPCLYRTLFDIGYLYVNYILEYDKGLSYHVRALQLAKEMGNTGNQIKVLQQIGYIHYSQGNIEKAIDYYAEALELAEQSGNLTSASEISAYMGNFLEEAGETDRAMNYYRKTLEIEKNNNLDSSPQSLLAIGRYYRMQENNTQCIAYFLKALDGFLKYNNHRWAAYCLSELGNFSLENGEISQAMSYADYGLQIASDYNLKKETYDNYRVLSRIWEVKGDYQQSLHYFKQYSALRDSIFSAESKQNIARLETKLGSEKKEAQIAIFKKENKLQAAALRQNRIIIYALTGGFILIAIVGLLIRKRYRQKRRINSQLKDRVELQSVELSEVIRLLKQEIDEHKNTQHKLEELNSELNNFMYKSSHDLKGPLASIIGLTNMAMDLKSDQDRVDHLKMIGQSTRRLNGILDNLLETARAMHGSMEVGLIGFHKLVNEVVTGLENAEYAANVRVDIVAKKGLSFYNDERLIKTILQNLVENAMKYKKPEGKDPWVRIEAIKQENGVSIAISDNGQGIATIHQSSVFDMFTRANLNSKGTGLGLYIVKKTVEKTGGTITLESQKGTGSTFTVFLPDHKVFQAEKTIVLDDSEIDT